MVINMMDDVTAARLKAYVVNSNDCLKLKLIRQENEVNDPETSFAPEMSHQVFGDSETIFGYKDLTIELYYSAGCLETYLNVNYTEKIPKNLYEDVEPDDIYSKLVDKLSPTIHRDVDLFIKALSKDDTFKPFGELIHSTSITNEGKERHFEIYKAEMSCKGFKEYHQRLQTFLLWYVDAASFIDVDDDQWSYFNIYEKYNTSSGEVRYATIGYATIYEYYAYPHHTRPRISQFLILPPFQKIGLGAQLLTAIYLHYISRNDVKDITVEDPSADFQRLRDYKDALNCLTLPNFEKSSLLKGFNEKMAIQAREKFKINKKQARRVYEILRLRATNMSNDEEYREYRLNVKKRLNIPFKREENDQKKLESALKNLDKKGSIPVQPAEQRIQYLDKEYRLLEDEYKKVIKRLDETAGL